MSEKKVVHKVGSWLWVHKGPILCLVLGLMSMGGGVGYILRQMKLHEVTWKT